MTSFRSHAVEYIACQVSAENEEAVYGFAYCDFREPNTQIIANLLGSIVCQLCCQLGHFPDELLTTYESSAERGHGDLPTLELLSEAIRVLTLKRRAYLLVDALDEAGDSKTIAELLVSLASSAPSIRILATSRNEVAIQRVFASATHVPLEHYMIEIDSDIEQYIHDQLKSDQDLSWLSEETRSLVSNSLLSKSKGT